MVTMRLALQREKYVLPPSVDRYKIFTSLAQKGKVSTGVPVHTKNGKQPVKNYRPISLLPICDKIFPYLFYDSKFYFLNQNNLISPAQSGFKPGDE